MKITNILFTVFRSLLGLFGIGQGNCLYYPTCSNAIRESFENKGLIFSGMSPDNKLPEIIELKNHPWFIGVQFHPEFKSRPLSPHPLFSSFIKAAKNHK